MSDFNILDWLLSHTAISITIEFFKKYSKQMFFIAIVIVIVLLVRNELKESNEEVLIKIDELSRGMVSKDSLINEQLKTIHEIDAKKEVLERENLSYEERNRILDSLNNVKEERITLLRQQIAQKDAEIAQQSIRIQQLIAEGREKDATIKALKREYDAAIKRADSLENIVRNSTNTPSPPPFKVIGIEGINTYGEEDLRLSQRTRQETDRASRVELIELFLKANREIPANSSKLVTISLVRNKDMSVNILTGNKITVKMSGGNISILVNVFGIKLNRGGYKIKASVPIDGEEISLGEWKKEFK